jgi:hypothetical protein
MQTVILRERHTFCGHSVSSFVLFCVSFTSHNLNVSITLKFTFIVLIFHVSNSGLSFPDFCTGKEKATPTFLIMILILWLPTCSKGFPSLVILLFEILWALQLLKLYFETQVYSCCKANFFADGYKLQEKRLRASHARIGLKKAKPGLKQIPRVVHHANPPLQMRHMDGFHPKFDNNYPPNLMGNYCVMTFYSTQ